MPEDYLPQPSTATPSMSADELWAVEWWAERMKLSRQQNLTPPQSKVWAETLRWWRSTPSDVTWVGQESTEPPSDR